VGDEISIRAAEPEDAEAIARIFNEGIAERVATFETHPKDAEEMRALIAGGALTLVAECTGEAAAFAKDGPYDDPSHYYSGVGEATMYVRRDARRTGVGGSLLRALAAEAERRGYHKLVGKIFTTNEPSIALVRSLGWNEVGVHRRHGRLDGEWKDVLVVERLLGSQ